MRLSDFLAEAIILNELATVGREYQHLEDLMIVNGASGAEAALRELMNIESNPKTLNIKWDGSAAIYWGRDETGTFYFAPKAQWEKKAKFSKQALQKEIESTGRMKPGQDPAAFAASRKALSAEWARAHDEFERATPKSFRGYLWADVMFLKTPKKNTQGNYEFKPNKVDYFVAPHSYLGERISEGAEIMVAVHGMFNNFGDSADKMLHASDALISEFNKLNPRVITLPIQHPTAPIEKNHAIEKLIIFVKNHAPAIDEIANYTELKFTGFKKIMYDYAVARGKNHGKLPFKQWIKTAKLSDNQKAIILTKIAPKPAFALFWKVFDSIHTAKLHTLDKLHKSHGAEQHHKLGLSVATNGNPGGEGFAKVTPGGAIKLINPHFRSAATNDRFK